MIRKRSSSPRPHFFLIGAAKAGTTRIYESLKAHPALFLPERKEPHYFSQLTGNLSSHGPDDPQRLNLTIHSRQAYLELFSPARKGQLCGEASTTYLHTPGTARQIHSLFPDAKCLAVLRHPVDRAFSSFQHLMRDGVEPCNSFTDALAREEERIENGWEGLWHYTRRSFYAERIREYQAFFAPEQLCWLRYDDLCLDPSGFLKTCCRFLGVPEKVPRDPHSRSNPGGIPGNPQLHRLLAGPSSWKKPFKPFLPPSFRRNLKHWVVARTLKRQSIPPELRKQLLPRFTRDIEETATLTGLDLSDWLS